MANDVSEQVLRTALPGFTAPQGMTAVPIMFSGSIPSLQYQDSSKGILLQNSQQNHLSPAQAFLNQHMSRNTIGGASQEPAQPRDSGLLPPILQNSKNPVARLQHHPRGQDSREHLRMEQQ